MTLFSSLISVFRPSGSRANALGLGESVPWDADTFPYHTVRRSIELAAMVPRRDGGRPEPAMLVTWERRSRRRSRRALLLLCAGCGLGLVLWSLGRAARCDARWEARGRGKVAYPASGDRQSDRQSDGLRDPARHMSPGAVALCQGQWSPTAEAASAAKAGQP